MQPDWADEKARAVVDFINRVFDDMSACSDGSLPASHAGIRPLIATALREAHEAGRREATPSGPDWLARMAKEISQWSTKDDPEVVERVLQIVFAAGRKSGIEQAAQSLDLSSDTCEAKARKLKEPGGGGSLPWNQTVYEAHRVEAALMRSLARDVRALAEEGRE